MMKLLNALLFISNFTPLLASHVRVDDLKYRQLNHHGSAHRRVVAETDPEMLDLARKRMEWNFCTNAYANKNFTKMTDDVPKCTRMSCFLRRIKMVSRVTTSHAMIH
jgi:hypothetical protein